MFTIAILSYNHPELTVKTVQSVLQHWQGQFEIILLHNGSQLKHQTQVKKKLAELCNEDNGQYVQHHSIEANIGFSGGANEALRVAFSKYDWTLFLTNDCQLHKLSTPEIFQSKLKFLAPLIWARKVGHIDSFGGKVDLKSAHLSHCKSADDFVTSLHYIPGTAFWMHKDFFSQVGPFDETLGTYWEDVDLCLRAHHLKLKMGLELGTEIIHGIGKTCHKKPLYTSYYYQRNRKRVCYRWLSQYWRESKTFNEQFQITCSMILLSYHLAKSWIFMLARSIRQREWEKLKLQWKALKD